MRFQNIVTEAILPLNKTLHETNKTLHETMFKLHASNKTLHETMFELHESINKTIHENTNHLSEAINQTIYAAISPLKKAIDQQSAYSRIQLERNLHHDCLLTNPVTPVSVDFEIRSEDICNSLHAIEPGPFVIMAFLHAGTIQLQLLSLGGRHTNHIHSWALNSSFLGVHSPAVLTPRITKVVGHFPR
ncbi:hypothetical protein T492DRAFT_846509 [Pavlovales sp. CCMP2436]|nr:hypothetical protein T492DRAFT_846509 [Pavlovales sp. CCMP2436]